MNTSSRSLDANELAAEPLSEWQVAATAERNVPASDCQESPALESRRHGPGGQERRAPAHRPRFGSAPSLSSPAIRNGGARPATCGTQASPEFLAREENLKLLKAIANSRVFTEFARAFTQATGLPVVLRPVQSFQLSFQHCRNQGPFCALMAQTNRTCGACLQWQSQATKGAVERPHTSVCYAGLSETVVPVRLGRQLIGFLWTGQVFQRKPTEPQFQRTRRLLSSWGMKLNQTVLRRAYFETPVVSREQHSAAVKLLTIFAEHLELISNQIVIQGDNAEPPMVTRAKDFIREHHADDLSLPTVARSANVSPFYLCKMFRRATGVSFTNFVCRIRVEKSRHLLINPQLRVSEVAFAAGFQSLSHFNRVFLRVFGQSPTAYRSKLHQVNGTA